MAKLYVSIALFSAALYAAAVHSPEGFFVLVVAGIIVLLKL